MNGPRCDERFFLAGAIGYLDCGRERGHEGIHRDAGERLYWHPAAPPIPWLEPTEP